MFCNSHQPLIFLSDDRFKSLQKTLDFLNKWGKDHEDSDTKAKNLITKETRDDINSTITGFTSLCMLKLGKGNSINFINSDIVENLFGQHRGIRNGLNDNPTLSQYCPATTAIILGQCSISSKCNFGKTAAFYSATTPCALNTIRNKTNKKNRRHLRI